MNLDDWDPPWEQWKERKGRELSVEHICTILLYICQHPLRKIACFAPFRSQSSNSISASKITKYPSRYRVYAPTKFIISLAQITRWLKI